MELELLASMYCVLKLARGAQPPAEGTVFWARTDREISLVCEADRAPEGASARSEGWRAFRVAGQLDFALIGVLAELSGTLAAAGISVFCVSTYDTDYILVKEDALDAARNALEARGHRFI